MRESVPYIALLILVIGLAMLDKVLAVLKDIRRDVAEIRERVVHPRDDDDLDC